MSDPCCNSFGGRITLEVDGIRYPARGDITIMPTALETTAEANQDGSVYYTSRPQPIRATLTLSQPCGLVWGPEVAKCKVNATFVEEDGGRTHLLTGSKWVGRPSLNLSTGEVSGLELAGGNYQMISDA